MSVPAVAAGLIETYWGLTATFALSGVVIAVACTVVGIRAYREREDSPAAGPTRAPAAP